jgi:hypothetical protein
MILLSYVAFGFVIALPIALALGAGLRRQLLLALGCPALLVVLVLLALVRGCPANAHECSPGLTVFYGAFLGSLMLIGWLLGIGAAAAIRRVRQSRSGSSASQGVR